MFPAHIPPELARHLIELGIELPPPAKPRDPLSDYSARTGVITQVTWKTGDEPNF